jgi:hypothetical protein
MTEKKKTYVKSSNVTQKFFQKWKQENMEFPKGQF